MLKSLPPLAAALLLWQSSWSANPPAATLSGIAAYRERMALPPDALFEATLEDVSRADAAAEVIGRVQFKSPLPPIRFTLSFDPARIDPTHRYVVRARILDGEQLLFITDSSYPVLAPGQVGELNVLLRRPAAMAPGGAATLVNTYWKLVRLGNDAVVIGEGQREPHLVLHTELHRVAGFGGCNRLSGTYQLEGDLLRFEQMAGTLMACGTGMDQESAFHSALESVARWRVVGETLELFDAENRSVAFFESRYMR